jgi:predicted HTH transcriptional regulator
MLTKPLDQITADDIRELCKERVPESERLEFKQSLSDRSRQPNRSDPWSEKGELAPSARDSLLREIVAFANAQGGTLVLGIGQVKGEPPCADDIYPLPRVHDLKSRMENAARDSLIR